MNPKSFARIATAIGKYWLCKRAPTFINEAQECLGGAGYIEESILPRLYRQAPLNLIWEGSGNIQCLDVLRALSREPETGAALLAELEAASGLDVIFDAHVAKLRADLLAGPFEEIGARRLVERLALALQAAVLLASGSPAAGLFIRSRLGGEHGFAFGTLPTRGDIDGLIVRALPF